MSTATEFYKIHTSDAVDKAREHVPGYNDSRDCTAVALAALMGDSLDVAAYALYDVTGKVPGAITWPEVIRTLEYLGYTVAAVPVKSKTVCTLPRELTTGNFLVSVSKGNHALALVGGIVADWSEGRRHRIDKVWEVTENK